MPNIIDFMIVSVFPDTPHLSYPSQGNFSLISFQPTVYKRIVNPSRGTRQLGWASFLVSADRVLLAGGTTFLHINNLAHLTGTTLGDSGASGPGSTGPGGGQSVVLFGKTLYSHGASLHPGV